MIDGVAHGDHQRTANRASLRYVCCKDAGIRRVKKGKSFGYRLPNGRWLMNQAELARIRKLALPPAWRSVWICMDPHGHLQATGIDARGRKQYRYDVRWRAARDNVKFRDLMDFASKLPRLRLQLRHDLAKPGLSRDKVLAAVVSLMARTGVRVGNERYLNENGSFGLTTLLDRHATITDNVVKLAFRGKGGKPYRTSVRDRRLARIVASCRDIPGQRLFQYIDECGEHQCVGSGDVNQYVHRISSDRFTAKTFRTWIASVLALGELRGVEPGPTLTARKRQLAGALENVAAHLGNTPAICRKSYVHPGLMDAFLANDLPPASHRAPRAGLDAAETDLVMVLESFERQRPRAAA